MKTSNYLLIAVLLCSSFLTLSAGPKEGVMMEFRKVEEEIRHRKKSDVARKKTLENNLTLAMKLAIKRRFYLEQKEILEGLNTDSILYESPTSPLVFFVKYRSYLVRFDFERNPEVFIQSPIYEKFLIRDSESEAHKSEKTTP